MDDLQRDVIKATYEFYLEESRAAQRYQFDLGKWLLASLILVNGGALVLLADGKKDALMASAAPAFVSGIVAALLCGLCGWLNAGARESYYDAYVQPASLRSGDIVTPENTRRQDLQIRLTYWAAFVAGSISAAAFVWGAIAALP